MTECAPTLNAAAGMSGNNRPFVLLGCINYTGSKSTSCSLVDESCFTITAGHTIDQHVIALSRPAPLPSRSPQAFCS